MSFLSDLCSKSPDFHVTILFVSNTLRKIASLLLRVRNFLVFKMHLQAAYYLAVCFVDLGCLDGGKVDLGGQHGVVPHGCRDDAQGDLLRLGDTCPTVACYIEGDGGGQVELVRQFLQVSVD